MRIVVAVVLSLVASATFAAASLTERTEAAMLRIGVRADQSAQFQKVMNEHYERCTAMFRRESRSSPQEVDKRVPALLRTISKDTTKHMRKVLDAQQMELFEYALDLENRRFMQSHGVHEPG